jgi:hypothetical protein
MHVIRRGLIRGTLVASTIFALAAFVTHAGVAARQDSQVGKSSAATSPPAPTPQKQQEPAPRQRKAQTPDNPPTAIIPTGPQVQVSEDDERKPVITHSDLVTLTVTVSDTYGRFVTGLNKSAFTVTDDKVPQEITFFSDEDAPVSLGVVFDLTGSMSCEKVDRARAALAHFLETSHNDDEYFLVSDKVKIQPPLRSRFSRRADSRACPCGAGRATSRPPGPATRAVASASSSRAGRRCLSIDLSS